VNILEFLLDILSFWDGDRRRKIDKKRYPKTYIINILLNIFGAMSGIVIIGYFIYFLRAFSGYNGG